MQITKQDIRNIGAARFKAKYDNYFALGLIGVMVLVLVFIGVGFIVENSIGNNIDMPSIYQETNTENTLEIDGVQSDKLIINGIEYKLIYDGKSNNDLADGVRLLGAMIGLVILVAGYCTYCNKMDMAAKELEYEAENQKLEVVD